MAWYGVRLSTNHRFSQCAGEYMGMTHPMGAFPSEPGVEREDDYPVEPPATEAQRSRPDRRQQPPVAIIRIARLFPGAERQAVPAPAIVHADPESDSLAAFGSEAVVLPMPVRPAAEPAPAAAPQTGAATLRLRDFTGLITAVKWVGVVLLSASTAVAGVWAYQRQAGGTATGSLTIQTSPAGLEVLVDGRASGVTPVTLALAPASYAIQVGTGAQQRNLAVDITAGSSIVQRLEIAEPIAAAPAVAHGGLQVLTDPPGQTVMIDDVMKGRSPLTIDALQPGNHTVVVRGSHGAVRRTVSVKAGETVSLVISPTAPVAPAPGWLSVQSSTRLELRQYGKLIGTTETEQLMLPAGEHDIELVNESVGYRSTRKVEVAPGKVTTLAVELPFGAMNLNAQPWAEVWIGGERIGETPIANLSRRIGSYEVLFRHPQLGERRQTVLVTLREPARIGVDMRAKQ